MKKLILKLGLHDDGVKQKAMKTVSGIPGIAYLSVDMNNNQMTVTGKFDAAIIVSKLRKLCYAEIVSLDPTTEESETKQEPKEEPKKHISKKERRKEEPKKEEPEKVDADKQIAELVNAYKAYNPHMTTHYYVHSAEESPNSCVIC